ncbi:hypothetical protein KQ298_01740 [Synechococcus sp. CS-1330]|nr:hypothetical protein [Synechococcus sp. CS-1330]
MSFVSDNAIYLPFGMVAFIDPKSNKSFTINGNDKNNVIITGGGADCIDGGEGNDLISAGSGEDILVGGKGGDRLFGESGDDSITGGDGNDVLQGGSGEDVLKGEFGNDTLIGGSGDDRLDGGEGNDRLTGDRGSDRFILSTGKDVITDFNFKAGDKIVFSGDYFKLSKVKGNVVINHSGGSTTLLGVSLRAFSDNRFDSIEFIA